jgi:TPM domain
VLANMLNKLKTILRHVWLDASDAERAISPELLARLTTRVSASEARHTGEIRIYVEAALPLSYLRRMSASNVLPSIIRQRALMLFGKLRVWDTEHNNGVLIYLQLAEHAIEIVADRGIAQHVTAAQWQAITQHMGQAFKEGRFEDGLTQALGEVSGVLVRYFPADVAGGSRVNQLPNEPGVG